MCGRIATVTRQSEGTGWLCPSLPSSVWVGPTPLVKLLPEASQCLLEGKVGSERVAARAGERPPEAEAEAGLRGRFQKLTGDGGSCPLGRKSMGEDPQPGSGRREVRRPALGAQEREGTEQRERRGPPLQRAQVAAGAVGGGCCGQVPHVKDAWAQGLHLHKGPPAATPPGTRRSRLLLQSRRVTCVITITSYVWAPPSRRRSKSGRVSALLQLRGRRVASAALIRCTCPRPRLQPCEAGPPPTGPRGTGAWR